ncbi:hypothetical protein T07_3949 [Trichinella nelsoni]|uniref:Uncharacterized protein n=1 Tax=Trichinella nelsoni TaxID=6336 RepID=A0A0V0S9P1_9BILA|nr:hypothetical protein T07_3949 [Trichinella nelsoni]
MFSRNLTSFSSLESFPSKAELKAIKGLSPCDSKDIAKRKNRIREKNRKTSGKVVQFAYHQLGVGGDVVVDDEHLLAMFEVIFESDGSADGEAKFAKQGLGTAVSGH